MIVNVLIVQDSLNSHFVIVVINTMGAVSFEDICFPWNNALSSISQWVISSAYEFCIEKTMGVTTAQFPTYLPDAHK